ncbi:hypothetical protein Dsin_013529 [Dipteronia sinensis]|uniref:DUF7722 domain-containing protein n=1 Tax=Dipteronia sinensis TaxID=43782 RepID=A0AAE0ALD0_9ROSI|nr:hypothetical protein Dsin_013529 [Dipteronia sinensis]
MGCFIGRELVRNLAVASSRISKKRIWRTSSNLMRIHNMKTRSISVSETILHQKLEEKKKKNVWNLEDVIVKVKKEILELIARRDVKNDNRFRVLVKTLVAKHRSIVFGVDVMVAFGYLVFRVSCLCFGRFSEQSTSFVRQRPKLQVARAHFTTTVEQPLTMASRQVADEFPKNLYVWSRQGSGNRSFQMPLHHPVYSKSDYETMPEWQLDLLLSEYDLLIIGIVNQKRDFGMGALISMV